MRSLRCATGFRSIILSIAACIAVGAANYVLSRTGLMDLPPRWLVAGMLLISAYLIVTRGAVPLWAMPLDRAGRFHKRIAIVGGGARPRKPFIFPDLALAPDIDIVGLFDDRFDDRSPKSIRTHHKLGKISELAVLRVSIGSISTSSPSRSPPQRGCCRS
jgi:hypothetical protein